MNLKKLLASIGLLAISAPTTLSLVACNDYNENKDTSNPYKEEANKIAKNINDINQDIILEATQTKDVSDIKIKNIINDATKDANKTNLFLGINLDDYTLPEVGKTRVVEINVSIKKNENSEELAKAKATFNITVNKEATNPDKEEAIKIANKINDIQNQKITLEATQAKTDSDDKIKNIINDATKDANKTNLFLGINLDDYTLPEVGKTRVVEINVSIKKNENSEELAKAKATFNITVNKEATNPDKEEAIKIANKINSIKQDITLNAEEKNKKNSANNKIKETINNAVETNFYLDINYDYTLPKAGKSKNIEINVSIKKNENSEELARATAKFNIIVNRYKDSVKLTKYLTEDILNLKDVVDTDEATNKATDVIKSIKEIKGKVNLADPKDGKIHVTVKDEFENMLYGEVDFLYNIISKEEYIVNWFNNWDAYLPCDINSTKDDIQQAIKETRDYYFFKINLNNKGLEIFDYKSFKLNMITDKSGAEIKGKEIIATDENPIEATISYDYGAIKNQKLNLIILPRKAAPISEDRQELLSKINNATPDDTQAYKDLWIAYINQFFKDVNNQKLKVQILHRDLNLVTPIGNDSASHRINTSANKQLFAQMKAEVKQNVKNISDFKANYTSQTYSLASDHLIWLLGNTFKFSWKSQNKDSKGISLQLDRDINVYWNLIDAI